MVGRINQWGDPWGGGWMDWPAGLITRLTLARSITVALQSAANAKPGQWKAWEENNPEYARTYDSILDLRIAMARKNGG
jgi:hypothetical protein